ncbi:uncharacterized transporter slc-17.2-like [Bradysia coprophila]|uniref:uncharacterized transporter slc-17.2-like n=1 Tax=Bradysia coprophila TaxID=38358 RepID=UPI00187D7B60|nr:uncharacterized transporter slc-17.2-like [Bradysia coprophila]
MGKLPRITNFVRKIVPPHNQQNECNNRSNLIPVRFIILLVVILSCAVDYITRVNINVAIVAMVKSHPHAHNISAGACPFEETITDVANNSSSFPSIIHDETHNVVNPNLTYDWSPRTQGIVLGSFWYSYMCMQVPSGRIAEELGGKWIVAVSLIGSAVINFITPLVTGSMFVLLTSRVVLGVLQGGIFPSCYAMLYKWMPQRERSLALAFMDVGATIGSVVAASFTGYLSEHGFAGGWPSAFYMSGLIASVTFVIWLAYTHSVPEEHPSITDTELRLIQQTRGTGKNPHGTVPTKIRGPPVPWRAIFTSPPVLAVIASRFSIGWTFFTILSKLPAYLNDVLHVTPTENGLLNASLYTASILSSVSAGFLSEKWIQAGYVSRTKCRKYFAAVANLGSAICLATVPSVGCNKTIVIALFIVANFCMGCCSGGDGPIPSEMTTNFPATVFAIANMVSCSSGFIAPYVIGMILESNSGDLRFLWSVVFYLSAALAVFGFMVFAAYGEASVQHWDKQQGMYELTAVPTEGSDDEYFVAAGEHVA